MEQANPATAMNALTGTRRPFLFSCLAFSLALIVTTAVYSRLRPEDPWLVTAAFPAFLLEGLGYLGATLAWPREQFSRSRHRALLLWASALLPYLVFSVAAGTFTVRAFLLLAGLTVALCAWHAFLPRRLVYDAGFLVIAAAPIVTHVFKRIYVSPDPHLAIDILGHVMWLRIGILAFLVLREWHPGRFGLWPDWQEWKAGVLYFAMAIVPVSLLATAIGDVHFAPSQKSPTVVMAIAIGTFFGILWVVALGEELLFRGVIARAVASLTASPVLAVLVSAVLFGCAHLWYHAYPNWRRALVATLIGLFCGTLYLRTNSVRAPMVTHTLIVVTWRLLFSS